MAEETGRMRYNCGDYFKIMFDTTNNLQILRELCLYGENFTVPIC